MGESATPVQNGLRLERQEHPQVCMSTKVPKYERIAESVVEVK